MEGALKPIAWREPSVQEAGDGHTRSLPATVLSLQNVATEISSQPQWQLRGTARGWGCPGGVGVVHGAPWRVHSPLLSAEVSGPGLHPGSQALSSTPVEVSESPGLADVDLEQVAPPPGAPFSYLPIGVMTSHHCYEESVKSHPPRAGATWVCQEQGQQLHLFTQTREHERQVVGSSRSSPPLVSRRWPREYNLTSLH